VDPIVYGVNNLLVGCAEPGRIVYGINNLRCRLSSTWANCLWHK